MDLTNFPILGLVGILSGFMALGGSSMAFILGHVKKKDCDIKMISCSTRCDSKTNKVENSTMKRLDETKTEFNDSVKRVHRRLDEQNAKMDIGFGDIRKDVGKAFDKIDENQTSILEKLLELKR